MIKLPLMATVFIGVCVYEVLREIENSGPPSPIEQMLGRLQDIYNNGR